ncbi:MAG: hypothetical protein HOD97_05995 [Candidatus Marinimicrobia bacterium]|nr:hypothetical protein [Candidatus Neomarinimicrobiota bacterium]MBT3618542.1 hypothetical protein [Candidatus Neomarinimicrobiota bacterium]MBT3828948.1 hypothetical protein [Candidatus Neomarinimicrobiota bacterium]MBT3997332.1 hypothetical protein [Candidatus Neomarinimicrobiota bacterium]MBT4281146.1 hypothetical protein [Candidatus Neomarinimicrobiota bacterium]
MFHKLIRACVLILGVSGTVFSQSLAFDWSGQFGLETEGGRLLWNRAWTSGPIVMDGTFAYFPQRYGKFISDDYKPVINGSFPTFRAQPDSEIVSSYIDYTRGDFLLDELEIGIKSARKHSSISIGAFKRDFAGREGQFLVPYSDLPIQQSYKLDYRSDDENTDLDVSAIRLISNIGMPDDSSTEVGSYKDEILSGGMLWSSRTDKWLWTMQVSEFNQKLKTDILAFPDLGSVRLNRTDWHGRLSSIKPIFPMDHLGFVSQSQTVNDSLIRSLKWSTIYAGWQSEHWDGNIGITLPNNLTESQMYANFNHEFSLNNWHIATHALIELAPRHYFDWIDDRRLDYETWYTGGFSIAKSWKSFELNGTLSAGIREQDGFESPFLSLGPAWKWEPFRRWFFNGNINYSPDPIRESDGIGLRMNIGIQGTEWLFKDNMKTTLTIWAETAGMRNQTSVFHPMFQKPISIGDETTVEDYRIFNFRMDAVISSVRIRYQILNLMNAAYPIFSEWFPDATEASTLFRPNPYFPQMGRRVSITITWQFLD